MIGVHGGASGLEPHCLLPPFHLLERRAVAAPQHSPVLTSSRPFPCAVVSAVVFDGLDRLSVVRTGNTILFFCLGITFLVGVATNRSSSLRRAAAAVPVGTIAGSVESLKSSILQAQIRQLLLEVIDCHTETETLQTAVNGLTVIMPEIRSLVFVNCLSDDAPDAEQQQDAGAKRSSAPQGLCCIRCTDMLEYSQLVTIFAETSTRKPLGGGTFVAKNVWEDPDLHDDLSLCHLLAHPNKLFMSTDDGTPGCGRLPAIIQSDVMHLPPRERATPPGPRPARSAAMTVVSVVSAGRTWTGCPPLTT